MNALPPPPGWHPDPSGSGGQRWWDGTRWTEHVSAPGVAAPGPVNPARSRYRQKWWHIPLLVGLAVASTVVSIVVQFLL